MSDVLSTLNPLNEKLVTQSLSCSFSVRETLGDNTMQRTFHASTSIVKDLLAQDLVQKLNWHNKP